MCLIIPPPGWCDPKHHLMPFQVHCLCTTKALTVSPMYHHETQKWALPGFTVVCKEHIKETADLLLAQASRKQFIVACTGSRMGGDSDGRLGVRGHQKSPWTLHGSPPIQPTSGGYMGEPGMLPPFKATKSQLALEEANSPS